MFFFGVFFFLPFFVLIVFFLVFLGCFLALSVRRSLTRAHTQLGHAVYPVVRHHHVEHGSAPS